MTKQSSILGADLGGTKLLVGEITKDGTILRTKKYPAQNLSRQDSMTLISNALAEFTENKLADYEPLGIGVGMIGRIDHKKGIWHEYSPTSKEPIFVADTISDRFGLPCFVDNDTRSAARAELLFGSGGDSQDFIYINVGTGIAAGIVSDGHLLHGGHNNAGEVGHTSSGISFHAPCFCGRADCVEPIASGMGLDKCARMLYRDYPDTKLILPDGERVSGAEIFRHYDGDALCHLLVDRAAEATANLIMNLVRMSDPDRVVLGGGLVADGFLFEKIKGYLDPYTMRYVSHGVCLTNLNPQYIGLLGACSNVLYSLEEKP